MSDITHRLRTWTHAVDAAPASDLMDEAANEIERLRDRLSAIAACDNDRPQSIATPEQDTTPAQGSVPTEWMSKPYWVDPPRGWAYGFPRLYDPAKDGDMTAWMVRNGYPQHLADKGLACTFTATE